MSKLNDTLIIIPAFNEELSIAKVVQEIKATELPVDVVVINDGSHDNTEACARDTGVPVISFPFNLGIGATVQAGFKFAQRNGYDYAIQLDGDGQHIPAEIPKILDIVKSGEADMAIGSRYVGERNYKTPFFRRMGMVIISAVNSMITGQRVTDNTSGFRAFNKKVIQFLASNYPSDYPEPEVIVLLSRNKFQLREVSVTMRIRETGESSINTLGSAYYMVKVLLAIFIDLFKSYPKRA